MKTKIVFKGLSNGKVIRRTIPIEHNFKEIPSGEFLGYMLPRQSVESQVIDYLDTIDKSEIMAKYNFDLILDYYIPKKKKSKDEEIAEFIDYLSKFVPIDRPIEAIISEAEDMLFGQGKSNKTKAIEVIKMLTIAYKASTGTMAMVSNMFKESLLLDYAEN